MIRNLVFIIFLLGVVFLSAEEGAPAVPIEITADGENRIVGEVAMAELNVIVRYGDDIIYADKISMDRKTKVVMASGNVRIYAGGSVYRGETLVYNLETKKLESSDFRMTSLPVFVGGLKITTPEPNHYSMKQGYFTTENRENPGFHFKASTVEIYNNNEVVLKNVVLYVGNIPVLWVPVFVQNLDDDRPSWVFSGGSSSRYGVFGRATYNYYFDKNMKGSLHFDARSKRGLAAGVDLKYKPNKESDGLFSAYWAEDNDAKNNFTGNPRDGVTSTRYRLLLQQKTKFKDGLSLTVQQEKLSDPHITEDFFENEYRNDRQPDSYLEAVQYNENFTISVFARDQVNGFYETVERLPELKIESKRFKLYDHLEYQSEYSLANLKRDFGDANSPDYKYRKLVNGTAMDSSFNGEYSAYRWDTLQQLLYPRQYMNWLSVTPRLGFRATAWDYPTRNDKTFITKTDSPYVQNRPVEASDAQRLWTFVGVETSFKVSKAWLNVKNSALGIDGIRHVAEPFINAQISPDNDHKPYEHLGFDERLPSHRLQAINPDQNNSIDSLNKQAIVRHGVRNKIQTKRDGVNYDLADWVLYADLDMARESDIDAYGSRYDNAYSNLFSDFKFTPLPWLTYNSFSSFDVNGNSYSLSDNSITWQLTRSWESTLGLRVLQNSLLYDDSNLIYFSNFYRLNEHWQFENNLTFETDDGKLQEQSYRIYRDMSSWQLAMTLANRDNRNGKNETSVYFTLTLKAFPSQRLSLDAQ